MKTGHTLAVLQALLVTFLWATSWVLIKTGLQEVPALPFAGLRYLLAFAILLPFALRRMSPAALRRMPERLWAQLIILGLVYYALTQGAQYLSLVYLPAATASLMLSFTAILVAFLGMHFLGERPSPQQWAGTGLYMIGVFLYFFPAVLPRGEALGLAIAAISVLANALASVLGRHLNRSSGLDPLIVTTLSMGAGALALFAGGVVVQGLPHLSLQGWAIVAWLAAVNSAFAFTLWNRTLRTLTAMESSLINNTMLFQIALLAWVFLGEALSWQKLAGIGLAGLSTLVVQTAKRVS